MSAAKPTTGPLEVGYYSTTDAFRAIHQHTAVMRPDGSLVAVTGPSTGKGAWEALEFAQLFAAAPDLLKALKNLVAMQRSGMLIRSDHAAATGHDFLTQACDAIAKAEALGGRSVR